MAFRPITGMVLTFLLVGCGPPGSAPADGSLGTRGSDSKLEDDFEMMERTALQAFEKCLPAADEKHFILVFQGLIDFASSVPTRTGIVEQRDFRAVLVDATERGHVPVLRSGDINVHKPVLVFRSDLSDLAGRVVDGWTEKSLSGHDVEIRAPSAETVRMHQEDLDNSHCSLKWVTLVDELVERPRHRLQPDVFDGPPGNLTTSRFVVGEGEAFTAAVFGGWDDPCIVRFARTRIERPVASLVAIAVPAEGDMLTLEVVGPDGEDDWNFRLGDFDHAVLIVRNHADEDGGHGYDFAGHLGLREGMNGPGARIPLPVFDGCGREDITTDNAQCSPANNDWP